MVVPANSSGYFDKSLYPRQHAQSLKEDMWALQYYTLREALSDPFSPNLSELVAPVGIPVYMIASYKAGSDDASSSFYRDEKTRLAETVAGGELASAVTWCTDFDCSLSFPVTKPAWTASRLMELGV